ncbi:unnamed protein product [Rotaria sp. Silwood2]|nr:unnamed protein product [Rotaria sp. Silwood2]
MTSDKSRPSPILLANTWSRILYSWISELHDTSHRQKTLHLADLYDLLPEYESIKLTEKLENNWFDEIKRNPDKPNLFYATMRTIRWKPFLLGFLLIPYRIGILTQPLLIVSLMRFFEPCSTMSIQYACFLAILSILAALCSSFFYHRFFFSIYACAMQTRVAYHGLIYHKILRLSSRSLTAMSSGEIVNIFSNDACQIEMIIHSINFLWLTIVDIIVMTAFFWYFVNYIAFIAIGYTLLLVLLVVLMSHLLVHFRLKILKVTDERINTMSEIIKSMRIVKMYCWESAFVRKISDIRRREIIRCALRFIPETVELFFSQTYSCITFFITYAAMWSLNIPFDTRFFAVAACILSYLGFVILSFGNGIRYFGNYLTAVKRLQKFLLLDESERDRRLFYELDESIDKTNIDEQHAIQIPMKKMIKVECNLKRAGWEKNELFALENIVFTAYTGDLICIIGSVGSGKSSLLQTLTGEIPFFDGQVRLQGSFCYVPQEPCNLIMILIDRFISLFFILIGIFSSTIKRNILFGKDYDPGLFRRVINATALDTDLAHLPHGVNTLVGDQGVMLSGGQKARVNMARALYRDSDIYLLDDPLSAVDAKVSKHLFDKSIKGYLCDKICILITHQIQFLRGATKIIVLENGKMVQTGAFDELIESSSLFCHLLENIHQQEKEQSESPTNFQRRHSIRHLTVIESEKEDGFALDSGSFETQEKGSVKWNVYATYLQEGVGTFLGIFILILMFGFREVTSIVYSWWLAKWSDDEGYRHRHQINCTETINENVNIIRSMDNTEWNEYRNDRFYFYCGIGLVLLILSFLRIITLKTICLNSGRKLHNKMFQRLIRCPISFFDLNPIGRILNRFTKDISIVDEYLPWTFFDFLERLFQVLGVVALVSWLNPWSFIPAIMATIGMLFIRHRFARCSRDLKRLESTARSPIYSYLTSTILGLKVIRSYHAEKTCLSEFFSLLDDNSRANYLFLITNRWAAIRFDWITISFIAFVTAMAVIVRTTGRLFSSADIALTLSFSLNLMGLLQWAIRQSVQLETQMTSIERILDYCALEQEPPAQVSPNDQPPTSWPSHGEIIFNDVSMSHSNLPDAPLALRNISLIIRPGEKIGIVGRTGAGKSSFIQTIFRMGKLVNGQIIIDNIDISTVGLDDIRRRISIIPQDPVLFTGTIKSNLDQFGDYSDVEIWHALEQVQLKKLVNDIMPHGLHSHVYEGGSNLSVGQKQLVCLARAILKKSKILVIDEATANVDNATDALIQKAIREQFQNCTVLTIAHRLRTVIDSDRIMVLGDGRILEFDTPRGLLSNINSQFSSFVKQTGPAEAEHLRTLATNIKFNTENNQEIFSNNETSLGHDHETVPLISSLISI